jgi:integrase
MPLKIIPPRNAKTKNLYIRGSYLGVRVDRSSGTARRSVARAVLERLERAIERGEYREAPPTREKLTFAAAARNYLLAGKSPRYVKPLLAHFGDTPVEDIDQAAIDEAAMALHPNVTNATRNTCVYTPVSAILKHNGAALPIKRPPGAKGRVVTDWLTPADAFGIIAAAEAIDPEFAVLLLVLLYTGPRIGGALAFRREDILLAESTAWARPQKGQAAMEVKLIDELVTKLAAHLAGHDRQRVFRFHYGGHLKHLLLRAKLAYLGLPCTARRPAGWRPPPNRLAFCTFHTFRHTWATWMRRYGQATTEDLADSGNWKRPRSAGRYVHAAAKGVWDRVEQLPTMGNPRGFATK